MLPAATARCADCYTVLFADEMNRCVKGHWTCPECNCDCDAHLHTREHMPSWLRTREYAAVLENSQA